MIGFKQALRAINGEIQRKIKVAKITRKNGFTKDDLRFAFVKFKGCCSKCGVGLLASGNNSRSARFALRAPIDAGGRVHRDNLIPVCVTCKKEKVPKRILNPEDRILDFNSLGDLIAHLSKAVVEEDEKRIIFFKRQVNEAITMFIQTLYYMPIVDKIEPVERIEENNSISDLIADLTRAFKEINLTKEYTILKKI